MKRLVIAAVALMVGFAGMSSAAEAPKIGVVDLQKIMQTSSQVKAIQQKLEKDFKPRRDQLIARKKQLEQDMANFKRDMAILTDTQKKETEQKIIAGQQAFERDGQQYQRDLNTAHNAAMESFYVKVRQAVSTVAGQKGYEMVLQKDAALLSSSQQDLTVPVLKTLGDN